MTQVFDRFFEEFAFGHVPIHFVLAEDFEDLADVVDMLLVISAVDQDIIDVYNHTNVQQRFQDVLDQRLEGSRGIRESEGHDFVLIMTVSCAKGCFLDVVLVNADLIVSPTKVNLGEDLCTLKSVNEVVNEGDWKSVLLGDLVEGPMVDAHAQLPILLLDKNDRSAIGRCAWFDGSSFDESIQLGSHCV